MNDVRKNALLVTYHNWRGKRQGGFHRLAEALCRDGYDVGFLTFPRPWYAVLKRTERENVARVLKLIRGERFELNGGAVVNFTVPTLGLPARLRPIVGARVSARLDRTTIPSVAAVCRRRLPNVEVVVYESTLGLLLYDQLCTEYPGALNVYRPSDPLVGDPACPRNMREAERAILERADVVMLVDECSRVVYGREFPGIDLSGPRFEELPNGIDLASFRTRRAPPRGWDPGPVALYVGAHAPDWAAVANAARMMRQTRFVVVCPERPSREELAAFLRNPNATFVPGVSPENVPGYVTNCDVMLVPYPRNRPRVLTLGVTAKMLQGMAAGKPIVALNVNPQLRKFGVLVCDSEDEFAATIALALRSAPTPCALDLSHFDVARMQERFISLLHSRLRKGSPRVARVSAPA